MCVRCSAPTHAEEAPRKMAINTLCSWILLIIIRKTPFLRWDGSSFGLSILQLWEIDALLVKA